MENDIKNLNESLINKIKKMGFMKDTLIENAFRNSPRHNFINNLYMFNTETQKYDMYEKEDVLKKRELLEYVYSDLPLIIDVRDNEDFSSISTPSVISAMLELLNPKKKEKIFEVGTGSGYAASLLSLMVGKNGFVFTSEIDRKICDKAKENIKNNGLENVYVFNNDGGYGIDEFKPFKRILISCSTADITKYWIEQLENNGTIVAPLITRGMETIVKLKKVKKNYLEGRLYYYVHFYSLRGEFSIISHYTYSKNELKTLYKIINNHANIDDDASKEISELNSMQLKDFFLYLSIHNKNSICYLYKENGINKKGFGLFIRTTEYSGLVIVLGKTVYTWGNNLAVNMFINEYEKFKEEGMPGIERYKLKVYADSNDVYESRGDVVISRKNSITVFSKN